ncbi:ATP-binding cassette domain-containing protein [Flavobacterium sp. JP2137]|uniref:ATP-binding cassette domain-containing protein n=1 Tax=Flavobacterium sp. JP2137 TaxID=3414510 RepID=UPI003D2FFCCE
MLNIQIIEKNYGADRVLENIDLQLNQPGIYGLVGKNGQGKTTLFRCVLGLEKYAGKCLLNGRETNLQNLAWCPAEPPVYDELTAGEFTDFYAHLLGVEKETEQGLFPVPMDKLIKEFSTGMKKKVYLNAVFQKEYAVYLLDEPFNGLDLESNYLLMQQLLEIAQSSIIIISSHIIDILYAHCQQIFVIQDKKLTTFEPQTYAEIQQLLFGNGAAVRER